MIYGKLGSAPAHDSEIPLASAAAAYDTIAEND